MFPESTIVPVGNLEPQGVSLIPHDEDTNSSSEINAAIWAKGATAVHVCLFDEDGNETAYSLIQGPDFFWTGRIPAGYLGQRYGLRVDGTWKPKKGQRFNINKLLLDPHARAYSGTVQLGEEIFSHNTLNDLEINTLDSAGKVLYSVLTDLTDPGEPFDWKDDRSPRIPWDQTVIYELHVKGFTQLNEQIPTELRGSYAGLAHPAAISYLKELGITAIELLPIHQFIDETHLMETGRINYWGYNSIGFFAPHHAYSAWHESESVTDPVERTRQINEFKWMVMELHKAGIEVILDVVYNHTAEGDQGGPTYSFKGLSTPGYYKLGAEDPRYFANYTGTGNTFDAHQPAGLRVVLDSLRYWVQEMHVDGFRFDLASSVARAPREVDMLGSFVQGVSQDPLLRHTKLIAEPWDIGAGGYQVGDFPEPWAEWNDKYRDCLRDFWRSEAGIQELGWRLTGSRDIYGANHRPPHTSVNFVTAHDGFTLYDLVSFNEKHNDANGESNKDGSTYNRSWNSGVEGPTDDPTITALRETRIRSFLTSMLLSHGTPMIVAGDEFGRTQAGNNNAYCQDSPITWINWNLEPWQQEQLEFTRALLKIRRESPLYRPRVFRENLHNEHLDDPSYDGTHRTLLWFDTTGQPTTDNQWDDPAVRSLGLYLSNKSGPRESSLLLLNGAMEPVEFVVPLHEQTPTSWNWQLDTSNQFIGQAAENSDQVQLRLVHAGTSVTLAPLCCALLVSNE